MSPIEPLYDFLLAKLNYLKGNVGQILLTNIISRNQNLPRTSMLFVTKNGNLDQYSTITKST